MHGITAQLDPLSRAAVRDYERRLAELEALVASSMKKGEEGASKPLVGSGAAAGDSSAGEETDIQRISVSARASKIVVHGGEKTVYLTGQVAAPGEDQKGVQEQAKSMLQRVEDLLAEAGSSTTRMLSATVYLKDIAADFAAFNEVWDAWIASKCGGAAPARACVEAKMARDELLCEVSVIASL